MKINLKRVNSAFGLQATNGEGQAVSIDANPTIGGAGLGMRPMELLASALASCTSIDVLLILKKKRIVLQHYEVEVLARRKDQLPAAFESIHLIFKVHLNDPNDLVEKAIVLSLEKYCSVSACLSSEIKITYEIRQEEK